MSATEALAVLGMPQVYRRPQSTAIFAMSPFPKSSKGLRRPITGWRRAETNGLPYLGAGGIGQRQVVMHVDITADDPNRLAAGEFFNQPRPARVGLFPCGEPQLQAILPIQLGGSLFHHRRFNVLE